MNKVLLGSLLLLLLVGFLGLGSAYSEDYYYDDYDDYGSSSSGCCGSGFIMLIASAGGAWYGFDKKRR